jgi:hypothetical protein
MQNNESSDCHQVILPFLNVDGDLKDYQSQHTAAALLQFIQMTEYMRDDAQTYQSILELAKVSLNLAEYRNWVLKLYDGKQPKNLKDYQTNFDSTKLIRVYYALAKQLLIHEMSTNDISAELHKIYSMTLTIHAHLLLYKEKVLKINKEAVQETNRSLIRINDILMNILKNKKDKHQIYAWFFEDFKNKSSLDFYTDILNLIVSHPNSFPLVRDPNNKREKYLVIYRENQRLRIIFSGRKMNVGGVHEKEHERIAKDIAGIENTNQDDLEKLNTIFVRQCENAIKYLEVIISGKTSSQKNDVLEGGGGSYDRHPTPPEPFELYEESIPDILAEQDIDYADKAHYTKEYSRFPKTLEFISDNASLTDKQKESPTLRQQMKTCRAFSAKVTKYRLLLTSDYETPTLSQLSHFLDKLLENSFSKQQTFYTENDIMRIMLTACIITGIEYDRLVQILERSSNTRNKIEVIKDKYLHIKLDEALQIKEEPNEKIFTITERTLSYKLPYILDLLLHQIIEDFEHYQFLKNADLKAFAESAIERMELNIHFKPKELWRLSLTFRREEMTNDVNAMFAMGKFQQNDKPRMHYHTTPTQSVIHSKWLEKYSEMLNTESLLAKAMGLRNYQPKKVSKEDGTKLTGTKKYIKDEKLVLFFKEVTSLHLKTNDVFMKHNLLTIHLRYAMSVLLGTREYKDSDNFSHISHMLRVMITSEKAQTELSGVRIIPMCQTISKMIQSYIYYCQIHFGITPTQPFLFKDQTLARFPSDMTFKATMKEFATETLTSPQYEHLAEFVKSVPLNIGRYIASNYNEYIGTNYHYLEAYFGHYFAGAEQHGKYSSMDTQQYISVISSMTESFARRYGIRNLLNV